MANMVAHSATSSHVAHQFLQARPLRTCCAFRVAQHKSSLARRQMGCDSVPGCNRRVVKAAAESAGMSVGVRICVAIAGVTTSDVCYAADTRDEKRGAAAEADVGGNFIPVIRPEDLPKGACMA